jgi:hypothetical protein
MGLPTQMNESERGVFALNGITGYLIAVVLLLSALFGLEYFGIATQKANAEVYYSIDQDLHGLKSGTTFSGTDGSKNYTLRKIEK